LFKRLRGIRDYGVFPDFDASRGELPDFSRRNLLYGWNYSGKTTLSRIFRSFETGTHHPDFRSGKFSLVLEDDTKVSEADVASGVVPIRVFNVDFVRENLKWEEAGSADPILVLGEASIAVERDLERCERRLSRRSNLADAITRRRAAEVTAIEEAGTAEARVVRETIGLTPFNRTPHLQEAVDSLTAPASDHLLGETEYGDELTRLKADQRDQLPELVELSLQPTLTQRITALLGSTAQQRTVERLKESPKLSQWVQQGLALHDSETSCQFCTKPLDDGFIERLTEHFSTEYRALQETARALRKELKEWAEEVTPPQKATLYPELQSRYAKAISEMDEDRIRLESAREAVVQSLDEKLQDVARTVPWPEAGDALDPSALNASIASVNSILAEHNQRSVDFEKVRAASRERLVRHHAASYLRDAQVAERKVAIAKLDDRESRNDHDMDQLRQQINLLRTKLLEEERGAQAVNRHLESFFGSSAVQVHWAGGKYTLRRANGERALNLSEGEKTAVAFSYFLATLQDHRIGEDLPIVYIDDPVSSLDSNHLYNTFSAIKATFADYPQVFLSTHDYGFFRLAARDSFFKEKASGGIRRCSWYLVRRATADSSEVVDLPNSLRRFHSEYHYLFDLCYRLRAEPPEFAHLVATSPNLVRRMLEIFSSFKIPAPGKTLLDRLNDLSEDRQVVQRIYKFANHGSHSDSIDLLVEPPRIEECRAVLDQVFDLIEAVDPKHFSAMRELVEP